MPTDPIQDALSAARAHHKAGRWQQAEVLYRQILSQNPQHPEAMHLLGVLAHQADQNELAIKLIRQSIALPPNQPDFHHNLAEVLVSIAHPADAEAPARRAMQLAP